MSKSAPSTEGRQTRYAALDAAILDCIQQGTQEFFLIARKVDEHAKPYARQMTQTFRVVDRRLQALRKRGRIMFRNKYWHLTNGG